MKTLNFYLIVFIVFSLDKHCYGLEITHLFFFWLLQSSSSDDWKPGQLDEWYAAEQSAAIRLQQV